MKFLRAVIDIPSHWLLPRSSRNISIQIPSIAGGVWEKHVRRVPTYRSIEVRTFDRQTRSACVVRNKQRTISRQCMSETFYGWRTIAHMIKGAECLLSNVSPPLECSCFQIVKYVCNILKKVEFVNSMIFSATVVGSILWLMWWFSIIETLDQSWTRCSWDVKLRLHDFTSCSCAPVLRIWEALPRSNVKKWWYQGSNR